VEFLAGTKNYMIFYIRYKLYFSSDIILGQYMFAWINFIITSNKKVAFINTFYHGNNMVRRLHGNYFHKQNYYIYAAFFYVSQI
jgi:hypothetical protein